LLAPELPRVRTNGASCICELSRQLRSLIARFGARYVRGSSPLSETRSILDWLPNKLTVAGTVERTRFPVPLAAPWRAAVSERGKAFGMCRQTVGQMGQATTPRRHRRRVHRAAVVLRKAGMASLKPKTKKVRVRRRSCASDRFPDGPRGIWRHGRHLAT
jgi:hypothetical protein